MMYLVGNDKQRGEFERDNVIPNFDVRHMIDWDVCKMYDENEGNSGACLNVIFDDTDKPTCSVQIFDEDLGLVSDVFYGADYGKALEAYFLAEGEPI